MSKLSSDPGTLYNSVSLDPWRLWTPGVFMLCVLGSSRITSRERSHTALEGDMKKVIIMAENQVLNRTKGKQTVLCIEDDRDVLDLLQIIFELEGYHWVGAFGGRAGLRTAQTLKPDLILLDIMMPDMNGWEVYARVKSDVKLRHIPIMILTVRDAEWDKRLALQGAQVADYVTKPFTPNDLVQRARQVLGDCG